VGDAEHISQPPDGSSEVAPVALVANLGSQHKPLQPRPVIQTSAPETDERIFRLECELANLKAKRDFSKFYLILTCVGGVGLGWLLAILTK
jgi:hypothetical protein